MYVIDKGDNISTIVGKERDKQVVEKEREGIKRSESIENLVKALSCFQAEVRNPANVAKNPFFNSMYAPLEEVLNTVRPVLAKHGLSVVQSVTSKEDGVAVTTIVFHSSGEYIEFEPLTLRAEKNNAQGFGSAITYARRYSISAALGISSEDDDDGAVASETNKAVAKKGGKSKKRAQPSKNKGATTELQSTLKKVNKLANLKAKHDRGAVENAIKKHHSSLNYNSIKDVGTAKELLKELEGIEVKNKKDDKKEVEKETEKEDKVDNKEE